MEKAILLSPLLPLILITNLVLAVPTFQASEGEVYIVQADDWLSKIALKYYGDMFAYPLIVDATNDKAAEDDSFTVIVNPDLIEVGQKVWLPNPALNPSARPLTLEGLKNAAYQGIYAGPVQLTGGKYEGDPFVEGGASRPTVTFIDPFTAVGDLNGDGVADAAVALAESSGGSGTFIYLAAVINQDGDPINQATQLLGDRVQLKAIAIEAGEIVVTLATPAPDDPLCCPSQEEIKRYRLQEGALVEL